jgi:hypothetical protein
MWSGASFATVPGVWNSSTLHLTISVERVPSYATQTEESLNKSSFLRGHASVLTTERYLGCKQNQEQPVNDRFGPLIAFKELETS